MIEKILAGLKELLNNFAKQVSLEALLITGSLLFAFIYYTNCNIQMFYVSLGCFILLIVNSLIKVTPKFYEKFKEKQFLKKIGNVEEQRKLFTNLDEYDIEVLSELYETYPNLLEYSASSPVILKLKGIGALILSKQRIPTYGDFNVYVALQPWMKNAIEKNLDLFFKGEPK